MRTVLVATVVLLALGMSCLGQDPATPPALGYKDSFQINFVNIIAGPVSFGPPPPVMNITNAGFHGLPGAGDICANIYTFSPDQAMVSCCSCVVGPNGLVSLAAWNLLPQLAGLNSGDLPFFGSSLTVKMSATLVLQSRRNSPPCDPAFTPTGLGIPAGFATGLRAWASHTPVLAFSESSGGFRAGGTADTEFLYAPLSQTELAKLTTQCSSMTNRCSCGSSLPTSSPAKN